MPAEPKQVIEFMADGYRINGPKVDGGWSITFNVGEYEAYKLKPHLDIPSNTALSIKVEAK